MAAEVGASLNDAVARRFVARAAHRAAFAVPGFVEPVRLDKAARRLSFPLTGIRHQLSRRAVVRLSFLVVIAIVRIEGVRFVFFSRPFLVEVVVFYVRRDAFLFQNS